MWNKALALLLFVGVTSFIVRSAAGCDAGEPAEAEGSVEAAPAPAAPSATAQNPLRESQRPPVAHPENGAAQAPELKRDGAKTGAKSVGERAEFFSASKSLSFPAVRLENEKPQEAEPGAGGLGVRDKDKKGRGAKLGIDEEGTNKNNEKNKHKGEKKLDPAFFSASKAAPMPVFRIEEDHDEKKPPPPVPSPPPTQNAQQAAPTQQAPSP